MELFSDISVIITLVIVGGIAGLFASMIISGRGLGLMGNIIIGIFGAFLGEFIMSKIPYQFVIPEQIITQIINAIFGAIILLIIIKIFKRS